MHSTLTVALLPEDDDGGGTALRCECDFMFSKSIVISLTFALGVGFDNVGFAGWSRREASYAG